MGQIEYVTVEGYQVELPCSIMEGDPYPMITWIKMVITTRPPDFLCHLSSQNQTPFNIACIAYNEANQMPCMHVQVKSICVHLSPGSWR